MLKYTTTQVTFREIPDEVTLCINISGCPIRCPDCHSKELWQDIGDDLTRSTLLRLIEENKGITCVCFMGHSSIENINEVIELSEMVKNIYNNQLKLALYSGYTKITNFSNINVFDYIKEGPYITSNGSIDKITTNQRFYKNNNGIFSDITDIFWNNWKYICNNEYIVSTEGKIYSLRNKKYLKTYKNKKGYLKVWLYNNKKRKMYFVHRLVAMAFLPNYNASLQVNHKDENKENNDVSNLEMCTANYNNNYGSRTAKSSASHRMAKHRKHVIQYTLNGDYIRTFNSAVLAGRSIGKNANLIRCCCDGGKFMKNRNKFQKITSAYGYKWKYEL